MRIFLVLLLSLLSGGILLTLLGRLSRRRGEVQNRGLLPVFLLAGAFSVLPTLFLYTISPLWFPNRDSGGLFARVLFIWLVNAPVEELGKYLCFAVVAKLLKSIKEPQDGSLQGAAVGLGFALVENVLYGLAGGLELLVLRIAISLPGHMIYGAVWGGYHGYEVYQGGGRLRTASIPLLALVPAIFSHAVFNTLAESGAPLALNVVGDLLTLVFGIFLFVRLRNLSPFEVRHPLKDWKKAVPELEHALKLNPNAFVLRQRLAAYLLAGGQPEKALVQLDRSEALRPGEVWTRYYRSAALAQLHRRFEAEELYSEFADKVGKGKAERAKGTWRALAAR